VHRHAASAPATNTATLAARGPAYLRGDLALMAADGSVALHDVRMAVCRCGGSRNKPFCDGSHAKHGFADDGSLRAGEAPTVAPAGGRLEIRARPDGPLMLTGPLTIVGTNGRAASCESAFLCRCGASGNKPYCDGTHRKIGFSA
jgi:CDGSH-type Zn-finger protein